MTAGQHMCAMSHLLLAALIDAQRTRRADAEGMVALLDAPPDEEHDEIHLSCEDCDPLGLRALCGTPLGDEWMDAGAEAATCAVCAALLNAPCPYCGALA